MRKIFTICVALIAFACKPETQDNGINTTADENVLSGQLPPLVRLNSKASEEINSWSEFTDLQKSVEDLYTTENREEILLVIEELVAKQNALAKSEYPEVFNNARIRSRQAVFRTYLLKFKAAIEYRTDPNEPALEMIRAYNALREQFNIVINSALDTKTLIDD